MIDILIAEDDRASLHLTLKALGMVDSRIRAHVARNGAEALAFLLREGVHADAPRPELIILDWNLPKVHGRAVPAVVRSTEDINDIPIVVLTTSNADEDRTEAAQLGANDYVVKAPHFRDFANAVRSFTLHHLGSKLDGLPNGSGH